MHLNNSSTQSVPQHSMSCLREFLSNSQCSTSITHHTSYFPISFSNPINHPVQQSSSFSCSGSSVQNQKEKRCSRFWRNESPREHLSSSALTWVEQLRGRGRRRALRAAGLFIFVSLTASAQLWWAPRLNIRKKQTGAKPR